MRYFHVKVTLAGKYTFIKTVQAIDAVVAVQDITHALRGDEVVCDIRAEIVDEPSPVTVEVLDNETRFAFRARHGDKVTELASQTEVVFIDGFVVATAYYSSDFFHLVPIPVALHALHAFRVASADQSEVYNVGGSDNSEVDEA